ncbi:Ophiobolin F synthase oblA [Cladobotryum mycophilum]|uniref:Ophiobolin F synthase oblA n=1 Tax=Cladobotryum mycophilum TaxID=491253 RepID=A0ABR0SNE3_9HYPO
MSAAKWEYIFTNSTEVPPEIVAQSRAFTTMPILLNKHNDLADAGSFAASRDWVKLSGDGREKVTHGTRTPLGNAVSFGYPEASSEYLGFLTYLVEICFLHDDACEEIQAINEARTEHEALASIFHQMGDRKESVDQKYTNLLSAAVTEWFKSGNSKSSAMFDAVCDQWLHIVEHDNLDDIQTLEDFLHHRYRNFGSGLYSTWMLACLDLELTPREDAMLEEVQTLTIKCCMLANDYFAWKREFTLFARNGQVFNTVWFLMAKHKLTEDEALEKVKAMSLEDEALFAAKRIAILESDDATPVIRRVLDACAFAIGGNNYWSSICPRYNDWESLVTLPPADAVGISDLIKFASQGQVHSEGHHVPEQCVLSKQPNGDNTGEDASHELGQQEQHGIPGSDDANGNVHKEQPNGYKQLHSNNMETPKLDKNLLDDSVVLAPAEYISSLPSKGVRKTIIEAIDLWTNIPRPLTDTIVKVIDALHNASLILDDYHDQSPLRRGSPATHVVFGSGQASNSASYLYLQATTMVANLGDPQMLTVFLQELDRLIIGQSWDLYWTFHAKMPSCDEYMAMVDGKTGSLFRMLLRLMTCAAAKNPSWVDLDLETFEASATELARVVGRFFQIRDDYKNLTSDEYEATKGFAEDLDERKCSYPLVVTMSTDPRIGDQILGLFRLPERHLSVEIKRHILKLLAKAGAFSETAKLLLQLEGEIEDKITEIEKLVGVPNPLLRLTLKRLSVARK